MVPVQICNTANLRVLDLSGNGFDGPTLSKSGRLENSEELHLEIKPLRGQILPDISDLRDLRGAEPRGCRGQLTGAIPKEPGNLETLRELRVTHPAGSGTIPGTASHRELLFKNILPASNTAD